MKLDIKVMDATLDEVQALIDAEKNAGVVEAIRCLDTTGLTLRQFFDNVMDILGEGG
jgi:hypothetical protein